ncbi:MAG: hypothetical protein ACM3UZ_12560 [Acidobacteriota bacterium]
MALIFLGMTCTICGKPINDLEDIVAFSDFVANKIDPLYMFSDAAFHRECFEKHPLAEQALLRDQKGNRWTPKGYFCDICGELISTPNEYFNAGYFTDDMSDPLYPFNSLHAHRQCIKEWPETPRLLKLVVQLQRSGNWEGEALEYVIKVLSE